jgi:hypothetical protein
MTLSGELQVTQQMGDWLVVENPELGQVFYNKVTGEISVDSPSDIPQAVSTVASSNKQRTLIKSGLEPVQEVCEDLLTPMISPLAKEQLQTLLLPGSVPGPDVLLQSSQGWQGVDDLTSTHVSEDKMATIQMLIRACNADFKKGETQQRRLGRATHLKLNGLQITRLQDLGQHCPRLRVLYAFDNKIRSIEPQASLRYLESCYLQNNDLREMASWSQMLPHLRVLNLSRNCIARLEGLNQCHALEDLNMSHQRLMDGYRAQLLFCPQTLGGLCNLRTLDISGNGLEDLAGFGMLKALSRLDASENCLRDVAAVAPVLRSSTALAWLRLEGNPLCRDTRYRDAVIGEAEGPLSEVDGKVVTDQQRNMCRLIEKRRVQSSITSARVNSARGIPKSARSSLAMAGGMAVMSGLS